MASSNIDEIKIVVMTFVFGGGMLAHALSRRNSVRKIQDTPRSKIASAPQGYVEIQGFAWPSAAGVVERNSQGNETVYYRIAIQRGEYRGSGKSRKKVWITVYSYATSTPFYLIDPTGIALIDPTGLNAAIDLEGHAISPGISHTLDLAYRTGGLIAGLQASSALLTSSSDIDLSTGKPKAWVRHSPEEKKIICKRIGTIPGVKFPPSTFCFGIFADDFRVVESEICVGSPLYVHGDFKSDSQNTPLAQVPGLTEFSSRVFNSDARAQKNLSHFLDKDGDGQVSGDEAMRGYTFAARHARTKAKNSPAPEKAFEVHGRMGSSSEHRLFIADLHEEHLVSRRHRFVSLEIAAAIVLIASSLIGGFVGFAEIGRQIASP